MSEEINPLEAKRLREAFKNTKDAAVIVEWPVGDYVEIRSYHDGKHARKLVISRDGSPIAEVPIINSTLKRLKREWVMWNDVQSGLMTAYRQHGIAGNRKG